MLTTLQARDRWIVGSLIHFLDRNLKAPYDIEVASTASAPDVRQRYASPIKILKGKPDDLTVVRQAPCIAVSRMPSGEKDRELELGGGIWRHRAYLLSCFPSLDGNDAPCDTAHELLSSYVQDVLETVAIKIIDYTNPACTANNIIFLNEVMYIASVSDPIDRSQTTALAQEKHRFDVHLTVKIPVIPTTAV